MAGYIWVQDPASGEDIRVSYDELDSDVYPQLLHPIGGFCYEVNKFTQLELPKAPYYIQSWLPKQGKALLYAPAKSGKSTLANQMGRCIAQGEPFLGIPTTQGRVLILQFELGEAVVQCRLKSTGKDYDGVFIGTSFAMKLDTLVGVEMLHEALDAIHPNVLILDPFYKIIKGDENEAHDVSKITDALDATITKYQEDNLSIFIIHHPGKDLSKGGRGSSVLEGWVDSYIEMRKTSKPGEPMHIRITPKLLRHAELPDLPIEATMHDFEFVPEAPILTKTDQIQAFFEASPTRIVTPRELIAENLGARKSVSNALETLLDAGVIMKCGQGAYTLAGGANVPSTEEPNVEDIFSALDS